MAGPCEWQGAPLCELQPTPRLPSSLKLPPTLKLPPPRFALGRSRRRTSRRTSMILLRACELPPSPSLPPPHLHAHPRTHIAEALAKPLLDRINRINKILKPTKNTAFMKSCKSCKSCPKNNCASRGFATGSINCGHQRIMESVGDVGVGWSP